MGKQHIPKARSGGSTVGASLERLYGTESEVPKLPTRAAAPPNAPLRPPRAPTARARVYISGKLHNPEPRRLTLAATPHRRPV